MKHSKVFRPAEIKKCMGKNSYKSETEAELVRDEQELQDISGTLKLKVYRCPACGDFHLTQVKSEL